MEKLGVFFGKLFGFAATGESVLLYIAGYVPLLVVAALAATPLGKKLWAKWEHKLVEGPYIHHISGVYGKYADILVEACKYIPALKPDSLLEIPEIERRWR